MTTQIFVITEELKEYLRNKAHKSKISISQYLRNLIIKDKMRK